MTRINVINPVDLCDQHLLAEHRELTRIPNAILKGKLNKTGQPLEYVLSSGHVKFFRDKLHFLYERYLKLHIECLRRGFNTKFRWPLEVQEKYPELWNDYIPRTSARILNANRIHERMPKNPRFSKYKF